MASYVIMMNKVSGLALKFLFADLQYFFLNGSKCFLTYLIFGDVHNFEGATWEPGLQNLSELVTPVSIYLDCRL